MLDKRNVRQKDGPSDLNQLIESLIQIIPKKILKNCLDERITILVNNKEAYHWNGTFIFNLKITFLGWKKIKQKRIKQKKVP